ncbi:CBS domain-containing protein [Alcaligenaceae bacterium]|nr:CBS domain-containing protein [Alcaligenaceae bacterium]
MLVSATLPVARTRLVTLAVEAPVIEAAKLLSAPDTHLLVVCNHGGAMTGVLTKADIVKQISHCTGCSCTEGVAGIMTRDVVACRPGDRLREVWDVMQGRALKQIPISDEQSRPVGVLYANDALQWLWKEAEYKEELLRDYVMGTGYR